MGGCRIGAAGSSTHLKTARSTRGWSPPCSTAALDFGGRLHAEAYVRMDSFGEDQPEKLFAGVVDKQLLAQKSPMSLANLEIAESWHFAMQGCSPVFGYSIPGFIGGGIELKAPFNEDLLGMWQRMAFVSLNRIVLTTRMASSLLSEQSHARRFQQLVFSRWVW